ncbi:hypothetical protein CCAL9344_07885 [Campylobacter sp. RM9344]|uniref:Helix-turn-helix domain-containing protein n=1 Tax=Campylobacter californiensis TaxID=1032243 RepID=A0AAW3ZVR8_9BACT|nr:MULTISPECIES: hypothetical protein [unclassified Campylobacter]MBE2985481.1 hypothetical protein [Campylobacter sp. RM6883]MBE2995900.1 hypothetical protein [Campylobacter sp. RM6913]MBE3030097.1 hypothetical protein [Campylobacter sp. RM9344]MBE3608784.1 hypothetical protein [Campylobacter sp. RM9337]QCD51211.1 hypothetical protein CCAL_1326 [Campylobacter sp. RM6914]
MAGETKIKKATLKEVADFLERPYETVKRWDKKKKVALQYGVPIIKEIRENSEKKEYNSNTASI